MNIGLREYDTMEDMFSAKNRQLTFILITMFLNFLGFSIIIPILPFLIQKYLSNPNSIALYVGLLMSSYAFCQFIASPGLGALSDRFGRRPILLISLFGSIVGYLLLAIGGGLWVLFLGRIIDGLTGGNISTVFAYIADITEPKDRGKYYGLLGAAGGFGFMAGPAIGGLTATIHITAPLYFAAIITFINMIWGYTILPESLSKEHRLQTVSLSHLNPFANFNHIFTHKALRILFAIGFIFFFALTGMQGVSSVFLKDVFFMNAENIGFTLFLVGMVDIVAQGYVSRKLISLFGDVKVTTLGFIVFGIGEAITALLVIFHSFILLYIGIIIAVLGDGLVEPSLSSLISNAVDKTMQGRVQGASQSMQAIARVLGPLYAAWLYQYGKGLPYLGNALLSLVCIAVLLSFLSLLRKHHPHL